MQFIVHRGREVSPCPCTAKGPSVVVLVAVSQGFFHLRGVIETQLDGSVMSGDREREVERL
jgi:hypothetical protein